MKIIELTAYKRPQYLVQVLDALSRCSGIEDYELFVHVDAGGEGVLDVLRNHPLPHQRILQQFHLGCNCNTWMALKHGFETMNADYVILVEDDILVSKDFLTYHDFCRREFRGEEDVLSVCGYRKEQPVGPAEYHKVVRRDRFNPWGIGTWKDRWKGIISKNWWQGGDDWAWDSHLNVIRKEKKMVEVVPCLSRVQNIGAEGGTYCPSPEYHLKNWFNPFWAGSVDVPAGRFAA